MSTLDAPLGKTERNLHQTEGPSIDLRINHNKSYVPYSNY